MTPAEGDPGPETDAMEYVLALEAPPQRRRFEAALLDDPDLAAAVWVAEENLRPLADAVRPLRAPPRVWREVEARLFGGLARAGRASRRAVAFWRGAASLLGAATIAAGVGLAVLIVRPELVRPPEQEWVAAIVRLDGTIALARLRQDGTLVAQPFPVNEPGSPELWLVAEGIAPISLGLIRPDGGVNLPVAGSVEQEFARGAQLVITLEPDGGSPTGAPTGPQLGLGPLTKI